MLRATSDKDTSASIGGGITGGTTGSVLFVGPGGTLAQDNANFFWDDTLNFSGFGTNTPAARVNISGAISDVSWTSTGKQFAVDSASLTDTTGSGTVASRTASSFGVPTFASTGAVTVTAAATVYIVNAPTAGSNTTITNGFALWVDNGNVRIDGMCVVASGNNAPSANFQVGTLTFSGAAWGTSPRQFRVASNTLTDTTSSGTVATITAINGFETPTLAASSSTTFTNAVSLYIEGPPTAGTNVSITNAYGLIVDSGMVRFDGFLSIGAGANAPSALLLMDSGNTSYTSPWGTNGAIIRQTTRTLTDTTSSGTVGNAVTNSFSAYTYAASSVTTFTNAATVYISAAPIAGTNVTLTSPYALWVDAGDVRFDGRLIVASNAAAATSQLQIGAGTLSSAAWGLSGPVFRVQGGTYTDTTSSGTVGSAVGSNFATPAFAASSATTFTAAATLHIANSPTASTNVTITNGYSIWVAAGNVRLDAGLLVGSGTALVTGSNIDAMSNTGGIFTLGRTDSGTTSAEMIGKVQFWNNDSQLTTQFIFGDIEVQAAQNVSTDAAAGVMIFRTTGTTVAGAPVESFRINSSQNIAIAEGKNVVLGTTTGSKIGSVGGSSGEKIGFFGATPIVQPLLATGTGATVDNVITALQNLGLVRQS